jgi:hypothetical protein
LAIESFDYGALAYDSPDGVTPAPGIAYVTKYLLTDEELAKHKVDNRQINNCMNAECGKTLKIGAKHTCRCCGKRCCDKCSDQRKQLFIASPEGTPGSAPVIEHKFLAQTWIRWKSVGPAAQMVQTLNGLSDDDQVKPIQLRRAGGVERTFPSSNFALQWLEHGAEDHSWERVCLVCRPEIVGHEMSYSGGSR